MVDTWLANQLLNNIAARYQTLDCGRCRPVPSVSGPGQVLADLLQIPSIPQTKLGIFSVRVRTHDHCLTSQETFARASFTQDFTRTKSWPLLFQRRKSEHILRWSNKSLRCPSQSNPCRDIQVLAPMCKGWHWATSILLNPASKDQVVFDTPDCQYRDGVKIYPSGQWCRKQCL